MSQLAEYLEGKVDLALQAESREEAVLKVLGLLEGDPGVLDFAELRKAVLKNESPILSENGKGLLIAHGRTEAVGRLLIAAGRCNPPLQVPGCECPLVLVFVAGIPRAFQSEYLRAVGAIVRIFKQEEDLGALLSAGSVPKFLEVLSQAELRFS